MLSFNKKNTQYTYHCTISCTILSLIQLFYGRSFKKKMLISELNCTTYIYDASLCCVIMGLNIEHFMLNETSINIVCECK